MGHATLNLSIKGRMKMVHDALKFWYGFKIADDEYNVDDLEQMILEVEELAERFGTSLED